MSNGLGTSLLMHDGTVLGSEAWFLWARQKADLQGLPLAFLQLWWGGGGFQVENGSAT